MGINRVGLLKKPETCMLIMLSVFLGWVLGRWRIKEFEISNVNQVSVLVANRDLKSGERIHFSDFSLRGISRSALALDSMTAQQSYLLRGALIEHPVGQGEILSLSKVQLSPYFIGIGKSVPKGKRAYMIQTVVPYYMKPGDKVDIVGTLERAGEVGTLVANVSVLQCISSRAAVLAVRQKEISLLEKAQQNGRLKLVVRNPEDKFVVEARSPKRRSKKLPVVEVIQGGK